MPLITFETIELPTTEEIAYVKEAIKVANINAKEFIAIVLPAMVLELTTAISLELLVKFLEEYYVKNEEEFIETSITSVEALTVDNSNE
jgi:hypothetical protein